MGNGVLRRLFVVRRNMKPGAVSWHLRGSSLSHMKFEVCALCQQLNNCTKR
jgi:hypothetical protein